MKEKIQEILKRLKHIQFQKNQILLVVCCLVCVIMLFGVQRLLAEETAKETMAQKPIATATIRSTKTPAPTKAPVATPKPEEGIYTYLQGPKSWGQRLAWSGAWGVSYYDGGSFGGFGCGLCCVANIYSSITKYQCTPVDAYRYAKKKTWYAGGGAIEWGYMRRVLNSLGLECKVKKKPSTYEAFAEDIAFSKSAVVLVSSSNSTCYWKETPGHYVTIYLYNPQTQKVFLADSGDPKHNRHWVSLKKIYKSLKTSSSWQYMPIQSYNEKDDQWKHKKADGNWVKP